MKQQFSISKVFLLRHSCFVVFVVLLNGVTAWGQTLLDNSSGTNVQTIQMSAVGEAYAQAFNVGTKAHEIRFVSVRTTNTAGAAYDLRMALWADDGGAPGEKLAESEVISETGTTLTAQRTKTWTVQELPILDANDTYWLSVELVSGAFGWDFKGTTDNPGGTGGNFIDANRISTDGGATWPTDYPPGGIGMIMLNGAEATSAIVTSTLDSGAGTLREAIEEANTIAGPSLITFHPDLSGETIRLDGTELTLDGDKITIDGSGLPDGIIISGDRGNDGHTPDDSRVFAITFMTEAILDSLIITGGRAPDGEALFGIENGGGGILNEGDLFLKRCTVAGNFSGDGFDSDMGTSGGNSGRSAPPGGGIANYEDLVIEDCTISQNLTGMGGDAVVSTGLGGEGGLGGGIFNGDTLTIRNSTIFGNRCGQGGNGLNVGPGRGGGGGGIYSERRLTVENCTVVENQAGDAVGIALGGDGGGILWAGSLVDSLTLVNTIVAFNQAGGPGNGGGTAGMGPDMRQSFGGQDPMVSGVNLIRDNTDVDAVFAAGAPNPNGDLVGTSASPIDPDLGPLEDNGGPTLTMLPQVNSPAFDPAGGLTVPPFPLDQRGEPRLLGARVDIGAVEAPDYAGIRAAAAAATALAAQRAQLEQQIQRLTKKAKIANRKKQTAKAQKLRKKIKRLKRTLNSL